MSSSVFAFNNGQATNLVAKVTGNTPVVVVDGTTGQINVGWFAVSETAGATPNLTVELYDVNAAISYYLGDSFQNKTWVANAVTAKQSVPFERGLVVPLGFQLRVTSSSVTGGFDVTGLKVGRAG